ncbi:chorion peroxidase [Stomoxys calcitrans]|uniref:Chorion peroxidase n=1 Tax=Stomoxys calcitrans TaxID=35570 RepID=A0A1I8PZ75_STOCA|nr:chorion peroxidase [Stomoxys calcitrans]
MEFSTFWMVLFFTPTILTSGLLASALANFKSAPLVISKSESDAIKSISSDEWLDFVRRGIESDNQEKRLELRLCNANVTVHNNTISHVQLLDTLPNDEAKEDSEIADKILKSSLYIYNSKCATNGIPGERCEAILSGIDLPRNSELWQECENVRTTRYNGHYAFRRLLPRHYTDGFYQMFSSNLPTPLSISNELCDQAMKKEFIAGDNHRNLAVVQWAQFVASDLSKTVVTSMSNGYPIECCNVQNYKLQPRHFHPACAPLTSVDPSNRYGLTTCLNYVRSALAVGNKCTFAAPEQLNQATADLDMSPLYGFTESARFRMRSHRNGYLKSTQDETIKNSLLPLVKEDKHQFCVRGSNSTCFMAGDSRVNSNPFTIAIYTIFLRNHNRLANELKQKYPKWNDEKLFQGAKAINIDIYQRIVLYEWLPIVLGPQEAEEIYQSHMKTENLGEPQQVSNEFAVAASRFYLSMMPDVLHSFPQVLEVTTESPRAGHDENRLMSTDIFTLKYQLYNTNISYTSNKLDDILNSILQQRTMKMDNSYVESLVSDFLGSKRPTHSDIMAFDIQRGRDHGVQPYFEYLQACNGIKITNWNDFKRFIASEDIDKLKTVYTNWQDIDLIIGGMSEIPAKDASVGPTFQCIIAEQFSQLHKWHRKDTTDLKNSDMDLSKYTSIKAADLMCLNSNLKYVPKNIFHIASNRNPLVYCGDVLNK